MALVINELQHDQNPPPDGLSMCGDFNWTLTEFDHKLKFNSYNGSEGLGVKQIIGAVFISVLTMVTYLYFIFVKCKYMREDQRTHD